MKSEPSPGRTELLAEIKARHADDISRLEKDPSLLQMKCWRTPADIAALIKMVEEATADDWQFCEPCNCWHYPDRHSRPL